MINKENNRSLKKFFIYKLEKIYAVQKYLQDELPYMIEASVSKEVKSVLDTHWHVTFKQVIRLNTIFDHLIVHPHKRPSSVVKKMIKESKRQIKETKSYPQLVDTGLIITWRGIDHYNIAAYAGLVGLSSSLALHKVSESLYKAMVEEMEADTDLREISGEHNSYCYGTK